MKNGLQQLLKTSQDLLAKLRNGEYKTGFAPFEKPKVAFLFTGQGSEYAKMGKELFDTQPVFKQTLEKCANYLDKQLAKPLLEILFNPAESEGISTAMPALFAFEYALAELWKSWGVFPDYVMGHSAGEYVAATVAGILTLEDGLKLITARSRLMQTLSPGGVMVAIQADSQSVQECFAKTQAIADIAAINSPKQTVISGKEEDIEKVIKYYEEQEIKVTRLNIPLGAHSRLVEPLLEQFRKIVQSISYNPPQISLISNREREACRQENNRCRILGRAPSSYGSI